jgi:hypothetical protein
MRVTLAVLGFLASIGCADRLTVPVDAPAPPAHALIVPFTKSASVTIPANNRTYDGRLDPVNVATVPATGTYRVRVRGNVSVAKSADWLSKPCNQSMNAPDSHVGSYGAAGTPDGWLAVRIWPGSLTQRAPDADGTPVWAGQLQAGTVIQVERSGLPGGGECLLDAETGTKSWHHMFDFVSQQTIEIEQLLPPQLAVSCPDTVLRGQVTTCTARAVPASAGLSVTQWTFSGTADLNAGPAGSSTFTFKPQSSGSVTVRATVGGANLAATTTVTALTDSMIAADPNDPPATPTNPRLVCTPSVQRGTNVTCAVEGATVTGWSFSDGALITISDKKQRGRASQAAVRSWTS